MRASWLVRPSMVPKCAQRTRAFTLIELLVVVVMLAIIAAVLVPFIISRAQRANAPAAEGAADIAQPPPALASFAEGREVEAPQILSSTVAVELEVTPILEDASVRARYLATFTGTFRIRAVDPTTEEVSLFFPFPPGAAELRAVSLQLGEDGARLREPTDAQFDRDGVRWRGRAGAGGELTAVVSYRAVGRDTFSYDIAGARRTGKVHFSVAVTGGRAIVPARSLEPAFVERSRIVWDFDKLISARPIVLELPSGSSPLGRAILLLRMAALAVLIFGAGYWYLGEGKEPGRLDGFRWTHFLPLALDYSLFFAACAVLLFWTPPWAAAAIAAVISVPLLVLHVWRIAGRSFALTRALPLTIYTLGSSVLAVFLEEHRSLILLGAGVVAVAHLTITYGKWVASRRAHRERKLDEAALSRLAKAVAISETPARSAKRALQELAGDFEAERAVLEEVIDRHERLLEASRAPGAAREADALRANAERLANELSEAEDKLRRAATSVREQRARERSARAKLSEDVKSDHCSACGASVGKGARYCAKCGTARPAPLACTICATPVRLPVQVLRRDWNERPLFCETCGNCVTVPA